MTLSLEQMQNIDLHSVDRNTLVNANDVSVDIDLPKNERMINVVNQMGDSLYCFIAGNTVVKVKYSKKATATVDEKVEVWLRST